MGLEEAIKQKKFESEQHKLALNILYTSSWLQLKTERVFRKFDITSQQYNVLRILKGQLPKSITVRNIQGRMLDRTSNITRLVDKLLDKSLVTRSENPEDRREQLIGITKGGLALLRRMDDDVQKAFSLMTTLTEEDAEFANKVLDKLRG